MTAFSITPVEIMAGGGALVALLWVWRASARRARAAADAARAGARLVSLAGRVVVTGGLITAAQWVVITHGGRGWLLFAVLGVPALFAAYAMTRALTITTYDMPQRRRGGGRR
ncbi:MAG TPA: hypothetical protein VFX16_24075 [Pseudonocardiaceae bacterium]|nr:hypothetical protein [Pseudonocardiaceae bacterium]